MGVLVSGKIQTTGMSIASEDPALFVDDRELHRLVGPHIGRDAFRAAIRVLEAKNFPRTCPLFRGRYFPAVKAFFDGRHGVEGSATTLAAKNGVENFDARP